MSAPAARPARPRASAPRVFRILVAAMDCEQSCRFYEELLGIRGRKVAEGRYYFDCGPVILGVLDYGRREGTPWATPTEAVYLSTENIDELYERARELRCLDPGHLHDDPSDLLGELRVRPWGERSFYAQDPSGNPLCFVESGTEFTGTPRQISSLRRALDRS